MFMFMPLFVGHSSNLCGIINFINDKENLHEQKTLLKEQMALPPRSLCLQR